jgi:putative ABC transport system ATP-binding protein
VLVLADEPTGNLDSAAGGEVMDLLRGLVDEAGRTLVLVTHDVRDAARADRLVRLKDGRIAGEHDLQSGCGPADLLALVEEPA